jgi:G3E family GTPase
VIIHISQFGEIDIDSDLVSIRQNLDPAKEQIMMLNNGCLCCTVRDDLIEMLNALVSNFKFMFARVTITIALFSFGK